MNQDKLRLDILIFERKIVDSREKAKQMILDGKIYVNGSQVLKPSTLCNISSEIEVKSTEINYVSRGGLKLHKAIKEFGIIVKNLNCIDVGASTGGFTDCLLKNGCGIVYCIDVGHDQLDERIKQNKKVINLEQTNIRYLEKDIIKHEIDFFTVDVSFISLKIVLPCIKRIIKKGASGVCLIKPQFEAGKENLNKRGVVKDRKIHLNVLEDMVNFCTSIGFSVLDISYSPIKGPAGNIEYLFYIEESENCKKFDRSKIKEIVYKSHENLKTM